MKVIIFASFIIAISYASVECTNEVCDADSSECAVDGSACTICCDAGETCIATGTYAVCQDTPEGAEQEEAEEIDLEDGILCGATVCFPYQYCDDSSTCQHTIASCVDGYSVCGSLCCATGSCSGNTCLGRDEEGEFEGAEVEQAEVEGAEVEEASDPGEAAEDALDAAEDAAEGPSLKQPHQELCDSGENQCSTGENMWICCDQSEVCSSSTINGLTSHFCVDPAPVLKKPHQELCDAEENQCSTSDSMWICCDQGEVCSSSTVNGNTNHFCVDVGEVAAGTNAGAGTGSSSAESGAGAEGEEGAGAEGEEGAGAEGEEGAGAGTTGAEGEESAGAGTGAGTQISRCDTDEVQCGDGSGSYICCDGGEGCSNTSGRYFCVDGGEAGGEGGEGAGGEICDSDENQCGTICCDQGEICSNSDVNGVTYYMCTDGPEGGEGGEAEEVEMCDTDEVACTGAGCCDGGETCTTVGTVTYCADGYDLVLRSPKPYLHQRDGSYQRDGYKSYSHGMLLSAVALGGFVAGVGTFLCLRNKQQSNYDIPMVADAHYNTI